MKSSDVADRFNAAIEYAKSALYVLARAEPTERGRLDASRKAIPRLVEAAGQLAGDVGDQFDVPGLHVPTNGRFKIQQVERSRRKRTSKYPPAIPPQT